MRQSFAYSCRRHRHRRCRHRHHCHNHCFPQRPSDISFKNPNERNEKSYIIEFHTCEFEHTTIKYTTRMRDDGVVWNKIHLSLITSARITKSNCIPIAKWAILLDFRQPVHDWFSVHVFFSDWTHECEWVSLCMCPMFMYAKKFVCCVLCLYEEWESSVAPLCSRPHENIHFSIRCGNCVDVCLFLCTHKMMLSKRCECGREMLTKKMNYCLGEIVR